MTQTKLSAEQRTASLYLHTVRANIGMMVAMFLLLFLSGPLPFIMDSLSRLARTRTEGGAQLYLPTANTDYGDGMYVLYLLLFLIGALVVGLLVSAFMHNRQAMDVLGALPVRRGRLLLSRLLGGLTVLFVPHLLNTGIFFAAQGVLRAYNGFDMGRWAMLLAAMFVYGAAVLCLTVFCAVNTGTVFDTAVLTLTLCIAPSVVLLLNRLFLSLTLIGYPSDVFEDYILDISPILSPFRELLGLSVSTQSSYFITSLVVWPVAAVLIAAAALLLFGRRNVELAGQTRSGGAIQLLTKLLSADIVGILVSTMFSNMLANSWLSAAGGFLLGAFVAYFVTEAILARGFKTFRRMLMQFAVVAVAVLLYTAGIYTGGLGYSKHVPAAQEIGRVEVNYHGALADGVNYRYLNQYLNQAEPEGYTDPQIIEQILKAHRAVVSSEQFAHLNRQENQPDALASYGLTDAPLQITYTMKNGAKMTRYFKKTPINARAELYALDEISQFRLLNDFSAWIDARNVTSLSCTDVTQTQPQPTVKLSQKQAQRLLDAMKQDLAALSAEQLRSPHERELLTLQLNLLYYVDPDTNSIIVPELEHSQSMQEAVTKRVYATDINTLVVLDELGLRPRGRGTLTGAYLLCHGSDRRWTNTGRFSSAKTGGMFYTNDNPVSVAELYFQSMDGTGEDPAVEYKDYAYRTGEEVLADEMTRKLSQHRITDPALLARLEQVSVPRLLLEPGERFYTVALEYAADLDPESGLAKTVAVYIIPQEKAPDALAALTPLLPTDGT